MLAIGKTKSFQCNLIFFKNVIRNVKCNIIISGSGKHSLVQMTPQLHSGKIIQRHKRFGAGVGQLFSVNLSENSLGRYLISFNP